MMQIGRLQGRYTPVNDRYLKQGAVEKHLEKRDNWPKGAEGMDMPLIRATLAVFMMQYGSITDIETCHWWMTSQACLVVSLEKDLGMI